MTRRLAILAVLAVSAIQCYGTSQVQMSDTAEPDDDLQAQIRELQKNVSDIWTYIYDLKNSVSAHLTHLRVHQMELESSVHRMDHLHEGVESHGTDSHHHSGEDHSHSSEHHSHGNDHSHGDAHGSDHHSHGDAHGSDHHSHSGEQHSHSGEQHSHGGDQHSHSGEHGHHSESHSHSSSAHDHSKEDHSHSHSSHDHSKEDIGHSGDSHSHGTDDHHHGHHHKDSHETEDLSQQTQQVASDTGPVVEPLVTSTTRREQHPDHSHGRSSGVRSNTMDLMNEHSFHSHSHSHHHHSHDERSKNRTVEIPKYADYNMYDFAVCNVQPNRAIAEDQQQNVRGHVTFWQKKSGGHLNIHVRLQGFSVGDHHGHHGEGQVVQQDNETPLENGHNHGFHIHAYGDLSDGCQSTGPHYNPKGVNHGSPNALVRHVGDLGNIECDDHGVTNIVFSDDVTSLRGQYSIYGKALVIHSEKDDLGLGKNAESLKTGNAGTRIACCIIEKVDKLAIRQYKVMKTAKEYKNF